MSACEIYTRSDCNAYAFACEQPQLQHGLLISKVARCMQSGNFHRDHRKVTPTQQPFLLFFTRRAQEFLHAISFSNCAFLQTRSAAVTLSEAYFCKNSGVGHIDKAQRAWLYHTHKSPYSHLTIIIALSSLLTPANPHPSSQLPLVYTREGHDTKEIYSHIMCSYQHLLYTVTGEAE